MRRYWLPSIGTALWLLFFVGIAISDWRLVLINGDGDPCLHRRIGEWMIEQRAVIRYDQFSHTRYQAPLISKEWLSEILFAAAARLAGWNGIVLLAAALIATTMWLLHRQLVAEGCELLLATGLVLVTALASSTHWLARPHLLTHLLTVVFAWQLRCFDRGSISGKQLLWTLAPLMLLWANLNGAFFTGFVLVGIYLVATPRRGVLAGVMFACLAASLINPNGWRLHAQVFEFLRTPELAGLTNEFRSPNFHSGGARGFLIELLVVAGMLIVARPRLRPVEVLLLGVWGYFALHSARNVPVFAIVAAPILGGQWNAFIQTATASKVYRKMSARIAELNRLADGRALALLAVGAVVAAMTKPVFTTDILPSRFPVAAVEKLNHHEIAVTGEMFNDYGWGGYLMLALPSHRVFTDGRNDFYGKALVADFNLVNDVMPGWEGVFEKYHVGWTILPVKHGLNSLLALRTDWQKLYEDDVAVIYGRR